MVLAMIVGVISLALGITNMLPLDCPAWMYIELPLYIVVAWLAGRMEVKRRATRGGSPFLAGSYGRTTRRPRRRRLNSLISSH